MSRIISRRNLLFALAAIVVFAIIASVIWSESASYRGRWRANHDLANGHYRILGYGLPRRGVEEYKEILRGRYGVEYKQVALCIVSESLVSYVDAYDEMSEAA